MKFKVGDRVKVYATLNGVPAETKGTVMMNFPEGMESLDNRIRIRLDGGDENSYRAIWAHPKQCRKLKKVPAKYIWVPVEGTHSDNGGFYNRSIRKWLEEPADGLAGFEKFRLVKS